MNYIFRILSLLLLMFSVVSLTALWCHDGLHGFYYDAAHLRMGSPPFIFIGLSFITHQFSRPGGWRERIKGVLLGAAFALWGSEQFLPNSPWLTLLDNLVIGIFVVDLGIIVAGSFFAKG